MLARRTGYGIGDLMALADANFLAFDAIWDAAYPPEGDESERWQRERERSRSGRLAGLFARMRKK